MVMIVVVIDYHDFFMWVPGDLRECTVDDRESQSARAEKVHCAYDTTPKHRIDTHTHTHNRECG
jgi:hypothetical protein